MNVYPELSDPKAWTPKMLYIHRRAMFIGLVLGTIFGGLITATIEIVMRLL